MWASTLCSPSCGRLGATCARDREKFDAYVRGCGLLDRLNVQLPKASVFDYCVDTSGGFVNGGSPRVPFDKDVPYFNILVLTGETTCYSHLLKKLSPTAAT